MAGQKYKKTSPTAVLGIVVAIIAACFAASFWIFPKNLEYSAAVVAGTEENSVETKEIIAHLPTPDAVKAIYMTSCVAGTPSFRKDLVDLAEETEINSIIIDVKDYTGTLSFTPDDPELHPYVSKKCGAPDMKAFIQDLHNRGIYVIARITVFQDPFLTKLRPDLAVKKKSDGTTWKDYKGLSFTDPGSKEVWDHAVRIGKASYAIGFDELNFDYIRFPSDGPMNDIYSSWSNGRSKPDVIEEFFSYLDESFKDTGAVLSADLFGMTTTAGPGFDLNIGQVWEKALPYFDYLAPMVYPSHYPKGWNGFANPNDYPYEVIKAALEGAVKKTIATTTPVKTKGASVVGTSTPVLYAKPAFSKDKIRPWIQDFDYGGNYDVKEVKGQIQAAYDLGLDSWMLWAPSNRYTRGALETIDN